MWWRSVHQPGALGSIGSVVSIPARLLLPPDPGAGFLVLELQEIWFEGEMAENLAGAPLSGYEDGEGQL